MVASGQFKCYFLNSGTLELKSSFVSETSLKVTLFSQTSTGSLVLSLGMLLNADLFGFFSLILSSANGTYDSLTVDNTVTLSGDLIIDMDDSLSQIDAFEWQIITGSSTLLFDVNTCLICCNRARG